MKLNYGQAIKALKAGLKVTREGWKNRNTYLLYIGNKDYEIKDNKNPDKLLLLPFIAIKTASGYLGTYFPATMDTLAEDWIIIDEGDDYIGKSTNKTS